MSSPNVQHWFQQFEAPLRRFAYRLCGSHDQADDLANRTMFIAHAKAVDIREQGKSKQWLFAVLRREFLQDCRNEKTQRDAFKKYLDSEYGASNQKVPGSTFLSGCQPFDGDLLEHVCAGLPPYLATCLTVAYENGFGELDHVAGKLGKSAKYVDKMLRDVWKLARQSRQVLINVTNDSVRFSVGLRVRDSSAQVISNIKLQDPGFVGLTENPFPPNYPPTRCQFSLVETLSESRLAFSEDFSSPYFEALDYSIEFANGHEQRKKVFPHRAESDGRRGFVVPNGDSPSDMLNIWCAERVLEYDRRWRTCAVMIEEMTPLSVDQALWVLASAYFKIMRRWVKDQEWFYPKSAGPKSNG